MLKLMILTNFETQLNTIIHKHGVSTNEWFPSEVYQKTFLGSRLLRIDKGWGLFASVFFLFREAVLQENLLEDARVRGRLISPGDWGRNLTRHPPCAAELPHDFEQSFPGGSPWFFTTCGHALEP